MIFEISWHPKAAKYLEKLPKVMIRRIFNKLDLVSENPFQHLEHFEGEGYKLRIGDYRALVDVNFNNKKLKIQVLDKRGRVYKRK